MNTHVNGGGSVRLGSIRNPDLPAVNMSTPAAPISRHRLHRDGGFRIELLTLGGCGSSRRLWYSRQSMRKTAIFTGAGASKAIGYPLTRELLPRVRAELRSGVLFADTNTVDSDRHRRNELDRMLRTLLPAFDRVADADLPLITDVFSLVEYAIAAGEALPIGDEGALRRCRDLLKHAITDVLIGDFLEPWNTRNVEHRRQKAVLDRLTSWIQKLGRDGGVVSTNYDIGIEYELFRRVGQHAVIRGVDLGFDWRDTQTGIERTRPPKPSMRIYKLHGSLDVLKCASCGYVYFNPWGQIAFRAFRDEIDLNNTCVCGDGVKLQLHIVAPSIVREIRDANLLSVWRSAHEWLRNADDWFIIGYSLPPEDLAIRSLLIRAYAGRKEKPHVTIVQHGNGDRARYELLFPGCTYHADGLEAFLGPA
jgi:hypothetical protein